MKWYKNFIYSEYQRIFKTTVEPISYNKIHITQLTNLLKPYCDKVYLSDEKYSLTIVEEAKKFSEQTKVQYEKWLTEKYDCDEFSFALMGYWNEGLAQFAFGICWSEKHAFNLMIDKDYKIWIVEPQTNEFFSIEEVKTNKKYKNYYPFKIILI